MTNEHDFSCASDDHEGWVVETQTPLQLMSLLASAGFVQNWTGELPAYIRYDPGVEPQYHRREQSSHDGTHLFSYELDANLLAPVFNRTTFFKPEPQPSDRHYPIYTIGDVKHMTHHQLIDVPAGHIPGIVERVSMPVRVEWALAKLAEIEGVK